MLFEARRSGRYCGRISVDGNTTFWVLDVALELYAAD